MWKLSKAALAATILALPINAFAIEFITEDQVQEQLGADKVIEISKYAVKPLVDDANDACQHSMMSRSGRAYVVKQKNKSALYLTPSGLRGLTKCAEL
jgi:hypothetical protein